MPAPTFDPTRPPQTRVERITAEYEYSRLWMQNHPGLASASLRRMFEVHEGETGLVELKRKGFVKFTFTKDQYLET